MGSHDHGLGVSVLVGQLDGGNKTNRILQIGINQLTKNKIGLRAEDLLQLVPCQRIYRIDIASTERRITALLHGRNVCAVGMDAESDVRLGVVQHCGAIEKCTR